MLKMVMRSLLLAFLVSQHATFVNSMAQCVTDAVARLQQEVMPQEKNAGICDTMKDMVVCLLRTQGIASKDILSNPSVRQSVKRYSEASFANLASYAGINCDLDKFLDEVAAEAGNPGTKVTPSVYTTFLPLLATLWCLSIVKISGLFVTV